MKKDTNITKVIFLIDIDPNNEMENEVFAFFTEEHNYHETHPQYEEMFTSYTHVGQHSGCSLKYAKSCKLATPEQYKDLAAELERIGYNLEILTNL